MENIMKRIAKFEKVSQQQFLIDGTLDAYQSIILPRRATTGSAGYDFFAPEEFTLQPNFFYKLITPY